MELVEGERASSDLSGERSQFRTGANLLLTLPIANIADIRLPPLPIVVTHDGQQLHRVEELKQRFNAVVPPGNDGFVDMQVLLKAQYFIPNPASSLSYIIHLVRNFTISSDLGIQRSESLTMINLPYSSDFTKSC